MFPLCSTTRKVTERAEDRHVVPRHPPLCDLSALDAEHRPEIKFRLATRGGKWAHRSPLRALIRRPRGDEIPLGEQKFDGLNGIGKDRGILLQEFFDMIKTLSLDARRCLAVAGDLRRGQGVERIRLTAVPCIEETPDHDFVLLDRCTHCKAPFLLFVAGTSGRASYW